jgi:asparagine synthetase B (glutamine-hydrolysing)
MEAFVSELLFETDWVGSRPVYYNEATGAASHDINDVIAFADVELDAEGLAAYLANGYSVFQRTPVRGVRIMPPSACLWRDVDGELRIEEVPLDLEARLTARYGEDEIFEMLRARVRAAESAAEGDIVIPTSGGYDSRLLNLMVAEPSRVRSYTFGPTARQWDSTEVARARALSELLGTKWQRIHLGPFHHHLDEWDEAFGVAVHAHGMYQMEFYQQVGSRSGAGALVLSGLCGDGFAGSVDGSLTGPMDGPRDVERLIFTNGMHADLGAAVLPSHGALVEEYFETHRELLCSPQWRLIEEVRFRVLLTHYLLKVPELYGLRVDAPFIDIDVAGAMMTLPEGRRHKRQWVTEYLAGRGAQLADVRGNGRYWLYWPAMRAQPLAPLDENLLAEIVRPDYVRWINRTVSWRGLWYEGYERLGRRPGMRRAAAWLRARGLRQRRLEAYYAYMTLRPLQRLLQRRDAARAGRTVESLRRPEAVAAPVLR